MATASIVTAVCMSLLLSPRTHVEALRFINGVPNNWHENGEWMRGNYKEKICGPIKEVRFSYNLDASAPAGPSHWLEVSKCCGGQLQSPIPLDYRRARCLTVATPYYNNPVTIRAKLFDTGHSVQLSLAKDGQRAKLYNVGKARLYNVEIGGKTSAYVLDNVHMHFGNSHHRGSEHVINGQAFQGEIHMVHYKEEYGSVANAMIHRDGLAVIGIPLSTTHGEYNKHLDNIVYSLKNLKGVGDSVPFLLRPKLLLPLKCEMFYYHGSLTTPPCSETVQFMIMKQPLHLTPNMLKILWSLPSNEPGHFPISKFTNVRPLQPVNSRIIATNFLC